MAEEDIITMKRRELKQLYVIRKVRYAKHNSNFSLPLIYTIELNINLLELNLKYPKNPKNFGQKLRKARMV